MRRLIPFSTALAAFLYIESSFAGGIEAPQYYGFDGFYAGVDVGLMQATFRGTETAAIPNPTGTFTVNLNTYLSDGTGTGSVQLGYGWQGKVGFLNYLGLFVQGDFYGLGATDNVEQTVFIDGVPFSQPNRTNISLSSAFSVGVKPGILLSPLTLLFAQAAASYAQATLNTAFFSQLSEEFTGTLNTHSITSLWGWRLGLGLEQKLAEHLSVSLSYAYTDYGHANANVFVSDSTQDNIDYDIQDNLYLVGLNYYFNPTAAMGNMDWRGDLFKGFYAGIFAGDQVIEGKESYNNAQTFVVTIVPLSFVPIRQSISDYLMSQNFVGGAQLGYNFVWNRLVLGLSTDSDFAVRYRTPSTTYSQVTPPGSLMTQTYLTEQDYIAASFNPGFLISTATLLFGRLGIVDSNFTLASMVQGVNPNIFANVSKSINQIGYRVGVGIEHRFSHHLSLYLIDQYTMYPTLSMTASTFAGSRSTPPPPINIFLGTDHKVTVDNNQALLGLNVYFSQ